MIVKLKGLKRSSQLTDADWMQRQWDYIIWRNVSRFEASFIDKNKRVCCDRKLRFWNHMHNACCRWHYQLWQVPKSPCSSPDATFKFWSTNILSKDGRKHMIRGSSIRLRAWCVRPAHHHSAPPPPNPTGGQQTIEGWMRCAALSGFLRVLNDSEKLSAKLLMIQFSLLLCVVCGWVRACVRACVCACLAPPPPAPANFMYYILFRGWHSIRSAWLPVLAHVRYVGALP